MRVGPRDAAAWFRKPDPRAPGILIYGEDPMQVATRRAETIAALIGPQGAAEMRLTRMSGADLRKDGAALSDAVRAQAFFPGPRACLVEDATDAAAPIVAAALADWQPGDAQIVVTAGPLNTKSALRKAFDGHRSAVGIGLYDQPPDPQEIDAMLKAAGLTRLHGEARAALADLARTLDPGDLRQTIDKLGLYMAGETAEVTTDDLAACAPQSAEADIDSLLAIVAGGDTGRIADVLRRLYGQGVLPVALCIGTLRHFRTLHAASSDPGGAAAGMGRARPPIFGPRRDAMVTQAADWGRPRLEKAISLLIETDLTLRSATRAPQQALVERTLIRLTMMLHSGR